MPITSQLGGAVCGGGLALTLQLLQPTPLRMELLAALMPALGAPSWAAPSLPPPHQPNAQAAAPQATDDR
jgi:hypothetical protein